MQKVMNHEYCGLGWKQTVQRPWGRTQLGSLEEQRGGLGGWSRASVGDREEGRAGRGRGSSCRAAWASGRTWASPQGGGGLEGSGQKGSPLIHLFPYFLRDTFSERLLCVWAGVLNAWHHRNHGRGPCP